MKKTLALLLGFSGLALLSNQSWAVEDHTWKVTLPVESHDTGDSNTPQIAFTANGNAVAVWQIQDGESGLIWASRYTVADKTWAPAVPIDTSGGNALSPQVAVDALGNALVVWSRSNGIQARSFAANGALGPVTPVQSVLGSSASPQIALANGTAYAVWHQAVGSRSHIFASRYLGSDQWAPQVQLDSATDAPTDGDALFAQIAMNASANAVVVWRQATNGGAHTAIWANRLVGTSWTGAVPIENNAGNADAPQVSLDNSGNARAIWFEFDTDVNRNRVWSSRYASSSNQWTVAAVEANTGRATEPQVKVGATGNAVAVWTQAGAIWSSRSASGSDAWDGPVSIAAAGAGAASAPSIALDASGKGVAVWQQAQPGTSTLGIYAARYVPGATLAGSWTAAVSIEKSDVGDAFAARVTFDTDGNAMTVWSQFDGTRATVVSNRYAPPEWSTAVQINPLSATATSGFGPAVATDAAGNAMMVWSQWDASMLTSVWSRRYAADHWGPVKPVAPGLAGSTHTFASIASDANGNVMAVWSQSSTGRQPDSVYWNLYTPTTDSWGTPQTMGVDSTVAQSDPVVKFDAHSNSFVAAWTEARNATTHIVVRRYASGVWTTLFTSDSTVSTDSDFNAQYSIDAAGNILFAWTRQDATGHDSIWGARYTASTGLWDAKVRLSNSVTTIDAIVPRTITGTDGTGIVTWVEAAANSTWQPRSRRHNGATWDAIKNLVATTYNVAPALAPAPSGAALLVYPPSTDPNVESYASSLYVPGNGQWDPLINVPDARALPGSTSRWMPLPTLASDAQGNALLVWGQTESLGNTAHAWSSWAARYVMGVGWGAPVRMDTSHGGMVDVDDMDNDLSVIDSHGNGFAVWTQRRNDGVNGLVIWARRLQ